jgi:deazaflavin-dependent oxidoreductase (nitroreductase family)
MTHAHPIRLRVSAICNQIETRMTMTQQRKPVVDAGFKLLNLTHKAVLGVTGGRWPKDLFGMPGVELQTIGNKSGEPRTVMLTSPIHDESRVVLIASKGGDSRDPQWYRNLSANPDVRITMQGKTRAMRARTASPDEKAAMWPDIVAVYKGYDSYQKKAGRDIPVVILEPPPA